MARWTRQKLEALVSERQPLPSLNGADLVDQDLSGLDLGPVDLSYAHLEGADLTDTNLRGAILFAARASGSCLRRADLRDANLTAADLSRSDLTEVRLDGADLSGTNLSGSWGADPAVLNRRGVIAHAAESREIRLDPSTQVQAVTLHGGEVLRVDLAQPAGGYQWTVVDSPAPVLDAAEPERHLGETDLLQGQRPVGEDLPLTLRFRARRPGHTELRLVLARSWEHGEPVEEITVDVEVLPTPPLPEQAFGETRRRKG